MSETRKVLFLLDAYALIYRAHFAFSKNPRISSKGMNTGVMFGFTNTLLEILQKEKPTHIGVVFDTFAPTFRHEEYKEYKAQRQETPEDVRSGIPWVKKIVEAFNIPVLEMDGFEADDLIGTLAKKAEAKGFETFMMTPDKDFGQLVTDHVFLYKPSYMGNAVDILGVPEVLAKWGIERVDQVTDILGMFGDSSDNIPGIPGIGAKTAAKFIKEYGSVESLVANVDDLKGKMKENVVNFGDQGILSKKLATIKTDVKIDFDEESLKYKGPDREALEPIFEELEFRTIQKRVFGEQSQSFAADSQMNLFDQPAEVDIPAESDRQNISNSSNTYTLIKTEKEIAELKKSLLAQKEFALNVIKDHPDPFEANLLGISFSMKNEEAFYVPLAGDSINYLELLKEVLEADSATKVGHDIKMDILILRKNGIMLSGPFYDIMLAHYLLEPETSHSLDILSENQLDYSMLSIDELLSNAGIKKGTINDLTIDDHVKLGAEAADMILRLYKDLDKGIKEGNHDHLLKEVEIPLLEVLADMEFSGVKVDEDTLKEISTELNNESESAQKDVFELAGEEFNINSPKQLGEVLFEKLQLIDKPKKTRTGQYATGEEILSKLARDHKIAERILDFRKFQKLISTYTDSLPDMISEFDHRIHTNYEQARAATGRLSSKNPNLQNIPIRTDIGRSIRKAFVPQGKGFTLLSADYSQIELRIMASFSKDPVMIKAFNDGRDIHATTASKIFKVDLDDVDQDMRRMAKTANFGMIYGSTAFGLSQNLNIPRKEAVEILESYFKEFSAVKEYMDRVINEARETGFVETILGRKRYLPDINSRNMTTRGVAERNAINAPIQGSAADMIKVAMVNINRWMKEEELRSSMIMQVHDELVFDVAEEEKELLQDKVSEFMRSAIPLDVPVVVDSGFGNNWLEAH